MNYDLHPLSSGPEESGKGSVQAWLVPGSGMWAAVSQGVDSQHPPDSADTRSFASAHIKASSYGHSRHVEAVAMAWQARQSSRTQGAAGAGGLSYSEPGPDNWTASGSQGEANWPQTQTASWDECSLGDGYSEMNCTCQPPASFPVGSLAKYRVGMTTVMLPHLPTWRTAWSLPPCSRSTNMGPRGILSDGTQSFPTQVLGLLYLTFQDELRPLQPQALPPWTRHGGAAGAKHVLHSPYSSKPYPPSQVLGGLEWHHPSSHQHPLLTAWRGLHWSMGLLKSVLNSSKAIIWNGKHRVTMLVQNESVHHVESFLQMWSKITQEAGEGCQRHGTGQESLPKLLMGTWGWLYSPVYIVYAWKPPTWGMRMMMFKGTYLK